MRTLALLLIVFTSCSFTFGQDRLMFTKNRNKIVYYRMGDEITFQLKGDRTKIKDQIRGFTDSLILFHYYSINPKEISHMYVDKKTKVWWFMKYKYEKLFLIGGFGYLLLDVLNTGELAEETLIISGSLITAGLLAKFLIGKKIKIRGKRRLYILNL